MGRGGAHAHDQPLVNRVRERRTAHGLSQQAVAERAGLTRQAVNGIETGRYTPNTGVALRLAHALGCRVEDLFALPDAAAERPVTLAGVASSPAAVRRVAVAVVRGRTVAHPLDAAHGLSEGFLSADGLLVQGHDGGGGERARLLTAPEELESACLLLGCDPSLGIVGAHVARTHATGRVVWLRAASRDALAAVGRGEAHIAGSHLQEGETAAQARRALGAGGGVIVGFAAWEQGFVVQPGNPKDVRSAADLARPDVRFINREPGSGCREFLDGAVRDAGLGPADVAGYGRRVARSHWEVARTVAGGGADCGVALRAAAEACGMDFVPLTAVRFDLVVPADLLEHPTVARVLDVLQTKAVREEIGALPGYDVSGMGGVRATLPAAS